jgi:hypothetical protein
MLGSDVVEDEDRVVGGRGILRSSDSFRKFYRFPPVSVCNPESFRLVFRSSLYKPREFYIRYSRGPASQKGRRSPGNGHLGEFRSSINIRWICRQKKRMSIQKMVFKMRLNIKKKNNLDNFEGLAEKLSALNVLPVLIINNRIEKKKFCRNIFDSVTKPFNANSDFSIFTAPTNAIIV